VIFYRRKQEIAEDKMAIAVVVQQMVDSQAAGVMFTVNPANQDRGTLVIEGAFGLGDTVVSGRVSPDHWEVSKETLETTRERLSPKHVMTYRDERGRNHERVLAPEEAARPSLSPQQVKQVASFGRAIEEHYGVPQDVEWAVADGKVWIVQSRPVTALGAPIEGESRGGGEPEQGLWGTSR
jgi:pyruvate,water dikinase